jgi:hypothetical protein
MMTLLQNKFQDGAEIFGSLNEKSIDLSNRHLLHSLQSSTGATRLMHTRRRICAVRTCLKDSTTSRLNLCEIPIATTTHEISFRGGLRDTSVQETFMF